MKKFLRNIILGLFVVTGILSCKNNVELNPGFTTISLRMKNNPRTIYPDFAVEDFRDFVLQGREAGTENWTISYSWDTYEKISAARLSIDYGTYDFQLTAKENETTFASEILSSVVISETASNNLSFVMTVNEYSVDGTGSFNFTLNWAKSLNVSKVQAFLSPIDKDVDELYDFDSEEAFEKQELTSFTESEDKYSVVYSASDVASGTYELHMILLCDGYFNEISRHEEVIYIADDITSTVERELGETIDENYSITYELNGGAFNSDAVNTVFNEKYSIILPTPHRENYTFMGWYTSSDFETGTKVTGWKEGSVSDNITVYARWGRLVSVAELDDYLSSAGDVCEISISDENPDLEVIKTALSNNSEKQIYLSLDECTGLTEIPASAFVNCTSLSSISIPDSVTAIGYSAFSGCAGLTEITIPKNVTSIGSYAFKDCTGVTQLQFNAKKCSLPYSSYSSFKTIGSEENSVTVTIGSQVESIPSYFLYNSAYVSEVIFEWNSCCTSIENYAFQNCTGLTEITIPESVTSIGDYAFKDCTGLTELQFNARNCSFSSTISPFCYCTKVTIGSQVESIPSYFLCNSAYVKEVIFEENSSCNSIGESALQGCIGLTNITIPESLTSIGDYAFSGCTNITGITIPENVASIGSYAFKDCTGVTQLQFNAKKCSLPYSSYSSFKTIGSEENSVTVTIGSQIESIPSYFLYNSAYVSEVIFEENSCCTSIGVDAFYGCTGLTNITIPESVTSIGGYAFYGCTGLTNITILESVTSIGGYTFYGCTGLTNITIPESVTSIGSYAFKNCTEITELQFNAKNCSMSTYYYYEAPFTAIGSKENSVTVKIGSQVESIPSYFLYNSAYVSEVIFEENSCCTSIGESAFQGCTEITSITIPENVESIGYDAFKDCTGVTQLQYNAKNCSLIRNSNYYYPFSSLGSEENNVTVTIGSQVESIPSDFLCYSAYVSEVIFEENSSCTSIGSYAFSGCTGITEITIPSSVTSIGSYAFKDCTGITEITIPENVTLIRDVAFNGCTGLTELQFNARNCSFSSTISPFSYCTKVTIGSLVESIPNYFLYNSAYVSEVIFEENSSCTSIGSYAFSGCISITGIIIPESVTAIGCSAFSGCTGLTNITISKNAATIGDYAFYGCTELTNITIPENVTSIGSYAFKDCTGLTEIQYNAKNCSLPTYSGYIPFTTIGSESNAVTVKIGSQVESIPSYFLYNSAYVSEVIFEENSSCTSIGDYAFQGCTEITNITIPENITSIGSYAFKDCTGLTEIQYNAKNCSLPTYSGYIPFTTIGSESNAVTVKIGSQVESIPSYFLYNSAYVSEVIFEENSSCTSIGTYAFQNCAGLKKITIPEKITTVGEYTFSGCAGLTEITIPESVTSIESYAFSSCAGLTEITIPENVTSIGSYAFKDCTSITEITIPENVTEMGSRVFSGCTGITELQFNAIDCSFPGSSPFSGGIGSENSNVKVKIGNKVETISGSLGGCYVSEVVFEENSSCTSIGSYAFSGCTGISEITIPSSVTSIGRYAFNNCTGLKKITIPENVTSIEVYAFKDCTGLTELQFNAKNCSLPYDYSSYSPPFQAIGSETNSVTVNIGKQVEKIPYKFLYFSIHVSKVIFDENSTCTDIDYYAFAGCEGIKSIEIPSSVTEICSHAFEDSTGLTEITIPSSVTSIGSFAFGGCSSLTEITIPSSVTSIGGSTFYGCTSLTNITIPESVTSIGSYAFYGCTSLTNITIPESVTSIGSSAFQGCKGLTNITIPESVTSIEDAAFSSCTDLTNITIPESVTSIGDSAFYGCTSLTNITIPESVNSIGSSAFQGCKGLTNITIPENVTSIGRYAFKDCSSLTSVIFEITSGWHYSYSSSETYTLDLSVSASTCAQYLTSTYKNYKWFRQ